MALWDSVKDTFSNTFNQSGETNTNNDFLGSLQSMLKNKSDQAGGMAHLLGPAALGGLVGALFANKRGRTVVGNTAMVGGGAALATMLWNKYKDQIMQMGGFSEKPKDDSSSAVNDQATRILKAMVFAARADGVVDSNEQAAIDKQVEEMKLGSEAQHIINEAMTEPLDPSKLAEGVTSAQEAMQIYLVSASVIDKDNFMENAYMDQLAKALNIPQEAKHDIAQAAT